MRSHHDRGQHLGVLALSQDCAEWLHWNERGESVHRTSAVGGENPSDAAEALVRAFESSGSPRRAAVLSLGQGWVLQRWVAIPPLRKSELTKVMARKAANLLECEPKDALFTALPFREDGAGASPETLAAAGASQAGAPEGSRWLLVAMRRSKLAPLLVQLRDCGLDIRRVRSSRLSVACAAQAQRGDTSQACIAVGVERRSLSVSLIAGEALINQNILEGSFAEQPTLALSLLQEIKSYEAFWRKTSRGGAVAQIVLIGFEKDRGELLKTALAGAIPGAAVFLRADGPTHTEHADRVEILASALLEGSFQVDLSLPLAPRARRAGVFIAGACILALGLAAITRVRLRHSETDLLREVASLSGRSADLDSLRAENERARAALDALQKSFDRAQSALRSGCSLSDLCHDALSAFGADAALLSMSVGRSEQRAEVEMSGLSDANPLRAARAVERIQRRLESRPSFEAVEALPSPMLPEAGEGASGAHSGPLGFTVKAHVEVRP